MQTEHLKEMTIPVSCNSGSSIASKEINIAYSKDMLTIYFLLEPLPPSPPENLVPVNHWFILLSNNLQQFIDKKTSQRLLHMLTILQVYQTKLMARTGPDKRISYLNLLTPEPSS